MSQLPPGFVLDNQPSAPSLPAGFALDKPNVAMDVGASLGAGLARGAAELGMLPVTIPRLMRQGFDAAVEFADTQARSLVGAPRLSEAEQRQRRSMNTGNDPVGSALYGGQDAARRAMDETLYAPRTTPGQYARTVGEFIPGALLPGATVGNVMRFGVVPGLASEAAGQATQGTAAEPWARAGAGIAAGLGMAALQRPSTGQQALEQFAGGPIPKAHIDAADALMAEAAARGVQLTPIEALNQVSGGAYTRLANAQRIVEQSQGGAPVMGPFMAQRPGQVQAAGQQAMDALAPNPARPGQTGIAVRNASQGMIDDTQAAINQATRPAYDAASQARVGPQIQTQLMGDPLYAQTFNEVRNNPALNRMIAGLPDDSVGVIDMVQRRMREQAQNARAPGQASTSNTAAAAFEDARTAPMTAAEQVTGGPSGSYATARAAQERLRGQYLEPLTEGRVGQMAATSDVGTQTATLFPPVPQAGSAPEVADAVRAVSRSNPKAAADLVGQHARTVFAEATQETASAGLNQFGGAGFAARIAGNKEQLASLEAAVKALPGGDTKWKGFSNFLEVMRATGQRLRAGSPTSMNEEFRENLRTGQLVGKTATTGGVGLFKEIGRRWDQFQLSRNTDAMADLLTNRNASGVFGRLAKENGVTPAAQGLAIKLLSIAGQGARELDQGLNGPRQQGR